MVWNQQPLNYRGGRLVGKVNEAARPWSARVKGTQHSAPIDRKTVVSNYQVEDIHERIETNNSKKIATVERIKVRRREPQKIRNTEKLR